MTGADITAADIAAAFAEATGDEPPRGDGARLEGDLGCDSVDLAALGAVLRERYGTAVDVVGYVAGLGVDDIIGLTVGDVAGYVNRCRQQGLAEPR